MMRSLKNIYSGKKVLITGHTGFKGSWLSLWLSHLGASLIGISDKVPTNPSHFDLLDLNIDHNICDIRDFDSLNKIVSAASPDIIFHLAAQPLVRYSYRHPQETFSTNVLGTLNVYECARQLDSLKAIVSITTDKVYHNYEKMEGYKETDRLGGFDPYSASKACVELLTDSYKKSYFNIDKYKNDHQVLIATTRAGNVIGGGDWAQDRLIPDIVRAKQEDQKVEIRSPESIRPWQHVLEPLAGYLLLGQKLLEEKIEFADTWNFGPLERANITVRKICQTFDQEWSGTEFIMQDIKMDHMHETNFLQLNSDKASAQLGWKPVWDDLCFEKTIDWYKEFYDRKHTISEIQLMEYIKEGGF